MPVLLQWRQRPSARAAQAKRGLRGLALLSALLIGLSALAQPAADTRRSGADFMGQSLREMQRDGTLNPGMLWVKQGQSLWDKVDGSLGRSCASCHGEPSSLRGAAAHFPRWSEALAGPVNLGQQINQCRVQRQGATVLAPESEGRLALEALVAHQSRGLPLAPPTDARLEPFRQGGQAQYRQRIGQLNLSCAQCHDERSGRSLGGSLIPQAHPTGYPAYRLEWQTLGSLQRRLRACYAGVRAEAPPYDARELIELELYLTQSAAGMSIETPAVRP